MPIDWTQVIIHVIGIVGSYLFGKRRGSKSRQVKDVDPIDRMP